MALTRCRECGGTVSTGADRCPRCGAVFRRPAAHGLWLWIGIALIAVVIFGVGTEMIRQLEAGSRSKKATDEIRRQNEQRHRENEQMLDRLEKEEAARKAATQPR